MKGDFVVRLDDVRDLSPRLEAIWQVLERHAVPVHLGAIPIDVTEAAALALRARAERSRSRVSVQQHGYRHVNHGLDKRRYEFADERDAGEQRSDLLAGRAILEQRFGAMFDTVFVPPWDRCGQKGLDVLAEAGFAGISVIETSSTPVDVRVPRVPMTTDPVQWKPVAVHRPWAGTLQEIAARLERDGYAGLELHHEIMDAEAAAGLDLLLVGLKGVGLPTMLEVAQARRA